VGAYDVSVRPTRIGDGVRLGVGLVGTFLALAAITHVTGQSDGLIVLGVVLSLTTTRSALREGRPTPARLARRMVMVPLIAAATALVGTLFVHVRLAGDALFVAAAFAALWTRRFPPLVNEIARIVQLPLLALFIAPVPPVDRGLHGLPWMLAVASVASLVGAAVQLPRRHVAPAPVEASSSVTARPIPARRLAPTTKLALQTAVALSAAFAIGQELFSRHWTWTVVSAFTVGAAARSRGDVIVRGVERLAGALAGTAVATGAVALAGGHRDLSVGLILLVLLIGLLLRETTYVAWAFCVTGALALLYGLFGESASRLLPERLAEVGLGAAVAIAAAVLVFPIRTEAVTRRAMAETLGLTDALLMQSVSGADEGDHLAAHAALDARLARLREVSRPLRLARRARLPGGHVAAWVDHVEGTVAAAKVVLATPAAERDRAAVGAARREMGVVRRHLRNELPALHVALAGDLDANGRTAGATPTRAEDRNSQS
jgi:hypothetical protein